MGSDSESEFPSNVFSTGPSWTGFEALKYLVIFGASYCDVGYHDEFLYSVAPVSTREQPLGVEFPGETYAEPGQPNWVGHLITNHSPNPNLLVYNYAKGGSRVAQVKDQVQSMFRYHLGEKPDWAPWTSSDTLFLTWVGINDAAYGSDHADNMEKLFQVQEILYETGARNFLFINVPQCTDLPPQVITALKGRDGVSHINWNTELKKSAAHFSEAHPDTTVMIFSSWDTFTTVLDDPIAHGFPAADVLKPARSIWVDHLHPTSKMHDFIARDIAGFLCAQPAFKIDASE
ncbi:hypothetical protein B0H10DRAFT_2160475 [Mycena sp. CBHHK59/15]|nr:hypothetical protein B0H10DRAFT_2160475 [Mycena sp. CBHHK59/15]